jgi:hypothetical protein
VSNVRYWPLADILIAAINVRFRGEADITPTCGNVCF